MGKSTQKASPKLLLLWLAIAVAALVLGVTYLVHKEYIIAAGMFIVSVAQGLNFIRSRK